MGLNPQMLSLIWLSCPINYASLTLSTANPSNNLFVGSNSNTPPPQASAMMSGNSVHSVHSTTWTLIIFNGTLRLSMPWIKTTSSGSMTYMTAKMTSGNFWASVIRLEGQNKVYQAQRSKLQADLVLTQMIATQALKRVKCSHNVEPQDTSPWAGPSWFTSPLTTWTHSQAHWSNSDITIKSTSCSPLIKVISWPPTPYPVLATVSMTRLFTVDWGRRE